MEAPDCPESGGVASGVRQGERRLRVHRAEPEFGDTDVRFVLVYVIEEYARHVGHADLLREAI
ncbi:DUF664 domain-containing protein [Streptomyces phaeochromogenes]|uniref:mycothiol transferase n=1 Tax=Streptomyces phaeochromogenes TaxID=1923 RepID=UPI0033C81BE6